VFTEHTIPLIFIISVLNAEMVSFKEPKIFICVSSVLTWAKTKAEGDDAEAAFAEDEYRRRKPHPNFKPHINAEKLVIKMGKEVCILSIITTICHLMLGRRSGCIRMWCVLVCLMALKKARFTSSLRYVGLLLTSLYVHGW
jgi:hypothetical protein